MTEPQLVIGGATNGLASTPRVKTHTSTKRPVGASTPAVVPGKRSNPLLLFRGKRNIPAIPNDMDHKRTGYRLVNSVQVKNVLGRTVRPSLHSLPQGNRFHVETQKISPVAALSHDARLNGGHVQSSSPEHPRGPPEIEEFPPAHSLAQITHASGQNIEHA